MKKWNICVSRKQWTSFAIVLSSSYTQLTDLRQYWNWEKCFRITSQIIFKLWNCYSSHLLLLLLFFPCASSLQWINIKSNDNRESEREMQLTTHSNEKKKTTTVISHLRKYWGLCIGLLKVLSNQCCFFFGYPNCHGFQLPYRRDKRQLTNIWFECADLRQSQVNKCYSNCTHQLSKHSTSTNWLWKRYKIEQCEQVFLIVKVCKSFEILQYIN